MKKLHFALTDTALRAVKPGDKPYKLADGGGLYALVNPNGSIYWRFKYIFGGKEKLLALGQYPAVKLAEARIAHRDAKLKLQSGIDPSAARQAERAGVGKTRGYRLIAEGLIRAVKLGRKTYVDWNSVEAMFEALPEMMPTSRMQVLSAQDLGLEQPEPYHPPSFTSTAQELADATERSQDALHAE
jgi:Arm DNA-binding domain